MTQRLVDEDLANPFWQSLTSEHATLAVGSGLARRYPADVIPFGALAEPTPEALIAFRNLLAPGELIYLTGETLPAVDGIEFPGRIVGHQMHLGAGRLASVPPSPKLETGSPVEQLTMADAPEMVALTDVAFRGFFRRRTPILGSYFGIRFRGELVAMAGERIRTPHFREISAVCTHPEHTGKGYARQLIQHVAKQHQTSKISSFLHVSGTNTRAISLYEHLGFVKTRPMIFNQVRRTA